MQWHSLLLVVIGTSSCAAKQDAGAPLGGDAGPSDAPFRYLNELASPADLATLTAADGGEVKYLYRVAGAPLIPPLEQACYFQDMHQFSWHLVFLRSFPELASLTMDEYWSYLVRPATRAWWGGGVQSWPGVPHPATGALGIMSYTIYSDASEPGGFTAADVIAVDAIAKRCIPFAAGLLVFVPGDPYQRSVVSAARAELNASGVQIVMPEQLIDGLASQSYSLGEGYGTLRIVPPGQLLTDYGPREVVIVESAPNDISLVSGLVTQMPQSLHSHVNLRLHEEGIPNAAVPAIYDNEYVRALGGYLVHLVVTETAVALEPARLEDAEAFWRAHQATVGPITSDLTVRALASFVDLRAADAEAYGPKVANLGELYRVLPSENRTAGFGVPFAHYHQHVAESGTAARIASTLADPRLHSDAVFKSNALASIRRQIRDAPVASELLTALEAEILSVFGEAGRSEWLRLRSSTNVEDLELFTGAGLYDSKSGCLADDLDGDELGPSGCLGAEQRAHLEAKLAAAEAELATHPERTWLPAIIEDIRGDLANERPVALALRRVWASLWNERAFDEREHYGIDHREAMMGVAVNPAFVMETANAVAITNLQSGAGDPLYRIVSQLGEESVVQPQDPTAQPEVLTFRRQGEPPAATDVQLLAASSLTPAGERVFTDEELTTLSQLLFLVQDHFATVVYPTLSPLHLDIEIKRTAIGTIVLKQARPYLAIEP